MKTFCFTPLGNSNDEIIIHAFNIEAARAKLEKYVDNISKWRLSNG